MVLCLRRLSCSARQGCNKLEPSHTCVRTEQHTSPVVIFRIATYDLGVRRRRRGPAGKGEGPAAVHDLWGLCWDYCYQRVRENGSVCLGDHLGLEEEHDVRLGVKGGFKDKLCVCLCRLTSSS